MLASEEFVVHKHSIGFVNSRFRDAFDQTTFDLHPIPNFKKLTKYMSDFEIESEIKPGLCELGDILAFLDAAPEECKDGFANLFHISSAFVVLVGWYGHGWRVYTWKRGEIEWRTGNRIFSPGNMSYNIDCATKENMCEHEFMIAKIATILRSREGQPVIERAREIMSALTKLLS